MEKEKMKVIYFLLGIISMGHSSTSVVLEKTSSSKISLIQSFRLENENLFLNKAHQLHDLLGKSQGFRKCLKFLNRHIEDNRLAFRHAQIDLIEGVITLSNKLKERDLLCIELLLIRYIKTLDKMKSLEYKDYFFELALDRATSLLKIHKYNCHSLKKFLASLETKVDSVDQFLLCSINNY